MSFIKLELYLELDLYSESTLIEVIKLILKDQYEKHYIETEEKCLGTQHVIGHRFEIISNNREIKK